MRSESVTARSLCDSADSVLTGSRDGILLHGDLSRAGCNQTYVRIGLYSGGQDLRVHEMLMMSANGSLLPLQID